MEEDLIEIAQEPIRSYTEQIMQIKESDRAGVANVIACALEVDANKQFKGGKIADAMILKVYYHISKELREKFGVSEEDYKAKLEETRKLAEAELVKRLKK